MGDISYQEYRIKNSKVYFCEVYSEKIADRLIDLNKYLYYVENRKHWRTGEIKECWVFEGYKDLIKDIDIIKTEIYGVK